MIGKMVGRKRHANDREWAKAISNVLLKNAFSNARDCFSKICAANRWQIKPDGTQMNIKIWFGGVLELCAVGRGAQRAKRRTVMHLRMRKSRSWLTLGGWFLMQVVLFVALCFVVYSTMRPERYFHGL